MSIKKYKEAIAEVIRLKDKPKHPTTIQHVKDAIEMRRTTLADSTLDALDVLPNREEVQEFIRARTKRLNKLIELIKKDMEYYRAER